MKQGCEVSPGNGVTENRLLSVFGPEVAVRGQREHGSWSAFARSPLALPPLSHSRSHSAQLHFQRLAGPRFTSPAEVRPVDPLDLGADTLRRRPTGCLLTQGAPLVLCSSACSSGGAIACARLTESPGNSAAWSRWCSCFCGLCCWQWCCWCCWGVGAQECRCRPTIPPPSRPRVCMKLKEHDLPLLPPPSSSGPPSPASSSPSGSPHSSSQSSKAGDAQSISETWPRGSSSGALRC